MEYFSTFISLFNKVYRKKKHFGEKVIFSTKTLYIILKHTTKREKYPLPMTYFITYIDQRKIHFPHIYLTLSSIPRARLFPPIPH